MTKEVDRRGQSMLEKMAITITRTVISGTVLTISKVTVKNGGRGGECWQLSTYIVLHLPSCKITSHNWAHAYNKGHAIKIARNVIQRAS
jgi:hypothetical protein